MTTRTILLVVLALTCGGSAVVGVSSLIGQPRERTDIKRIVTAAVSMPRGGTLSAKSLKLQDWPKALVPPGAMFSLEDAIDRSALVPLVAGEPVLDGKLASKGAGRGLASMIPMGMRAFTIHTPHVAAGVGGFIMPGNKVDVLLTTTDTGPNDETGGGATTMLLQNVTVLAVAQNIDAPDSNKVDPQELKSVTLLVTPHQVSKLDLGMNKGVLHLAMRNPEDNKDGGASPATMADLRFHQEKPSPLVDLTPLADLLRKLAQATKHEPRPTRIHTIRGTAIGMIKTNHQQ